MNYYKLPEASKKRRLCILFLTLLLIFNSCNKTSSNETAEIKLKDDLEREVVLMKQPVKVMALSSGLTEILFAVCPDSQIVAVTHRCNFPSQVKDKPKVNTYPLDLEAIAMLQPDLIFSEEGMTSMDNVDRIQQLGIPVYFTSYRTIDDIFKAMLKVGELTGNTANAKQVVDSLKQQRNMLVEEAKVLERPKVLAVTWTDPIYVHGFNTIMTDKLRAAGADNAVQEAFEKNYPELSREYILQIDPDVILGGSFEKMDSTFFSVYPELKRTKAYRYKKVFATTDDLTSRPSPRVLESVLELRKLIHGL